MPNAMKVLQGLQVLCDVGYTDKWPNAKDGCIWFAGPAPEHLRPEEFDILYKADFFYDIETGLWFCDCSITDLLEE